MARPNILLIVLDSLRRDHLPCYGYARNTAPNLQKIADQAAVYDHAFADGGWTVPSMASMFTGLCGREHRGEQQRGLPPGIPTVAEALQAAGYHTVAVSTNPFTTPATGFGRGFQRFSFIRPRQGIARLPRCFSVPFHLVDKGGAQAVTALLRHLSRCPRPYFAYLHLNETHAPFGAVCPYTRKFVSASRGLVEQWRLILRARRAYTFMSEATPDDYEFLTDLYDGQVAYADALIGRVWEAVQELRRTEETALVLAADHGEMLGEHGFLGHTFQLSEPIARIPLVVDVPGIVPPGSRMEGLVQTRDLARALTNLAGCDGLASSAAPSTDLFSACRQTDGHRVAFAERQELPAEWVAANRKKQPSLDYGLHNVHLVTARDPRYKLVRDGRAQRRLYDLWTDPGEHVDLLATHPLEAQRLEWELDSWLESVRPWGELACPDEEAPPEVVERLQELGYIA